MTDTKKKSTNKSNSNDKKAFRFLCVMLTLIVIFVATVCIFTGKRNNKLKEASVSADQHSTIASVSNGSNGTTQAKAQDTTKAPETTKSSLAEKPGTFENPTIITIDEKNWQLTLVNSYYRIPDDYEPDLVYVCGSSERLDKKVAENYEKMYEAAKADGVTLTPCSGYRSYELQERNYNNKIAFYESQGYSNKDAKVKAATIIMPPGSSEHNLGYAMDIVCVDEWFEDTEEFKWLTENAADYGFIMRYPKDKQDITRVIYEPWHWRYVGVETAKELKSSGLVLEEYLGVA